MITITKIIKWHSDNCQNPNLKSIGNRKYEAKNVNIELHKKDIEKYRKEIELKTGLQIDLYHYEKI